MKPRLYFSHWFPKLLGVSAVTLYPLIFFAYDKATSITYHVVAHEYVHVLQVRKLGWLKFYWTYLVQYFKGRLSGKSASAAYYNVSYEMEAYEQQNNQTVPEDFV